MNTNKYKKGSTLLEVVAAMCVLTIVAVMVFPAIDANIRVNHTMKNRIVAEAEGSTFADRISKYAKTVKGEEFWSQIENGYGLEPYKFALDLDRDMWFTKSGDTVIYLYQMEGMSNLVIRSEYKGSVYETFVLADFMQEETGGPQ